MEELEPESPDDEFGEGSTHAGRSSGHGEEKSVTWGSDPGRVSWGDKVGEKKRWLTKCMAGKTAGGIAGLLAGAGLTLGLLNAIDLGDSEWVEIIIGVVVVLGAGFGGFLYGGVATGCWV